MTEKKPYFPVLEAEISRAGLRKKDIAEHLGITPRAFSGKLTGETDLWWTEILAIHSFFPEISPLELFRHEGN